MSVEKDDATINLIQMLIYCVKHIQERNMMPLKCRMSAKIQKRDLQAKECFFKKRYFQSKDNMLCAFDPK